MQLPNNIIELRERWNNGERFEFFLFYGHKPPENGVNASCFSQWFVRDFKIDGVQYPTAEHWMMAEKARLFGDDEMLQEILDSNSPRDAKAFGRKVQGFEPGVWDEHKFEIVKRGNVAKFSQNLKMRDFLLSTAEYTTPVLDAVAETKPGYDVKGSEVKESLQIYKFDSSKRESAEPESEVPAASNSESKVILVEAAGRDCIWGIGLGQHNPKAQDPTQWRGKNLLGFVLTEVREYLMEL